LADYGIIVPPAMSFVKAFDTDEPRFGGQGRIAQAQRFEPETVRRGDELIQQIKLYLPARTAIVLEGVARRRQKG
jgi:hypothetical protein